MTKETCISAANLPVWVCISCWRQRATKYSYSASARSGARICVDAVQRYLNDEKEKGKLTGGMLLRLMGLDLSNSDGPLKDY